MLGQNLISARIVGLRRAGQISARTAVRSWLREMGGRKWHKVIFLALCVFLFFGGCGKHKCAVCGDGASCKLIFMGKEFDLCRDCYKTYVEEQQLFDGEL